MWSLLVIQLSPVLVCFQLCNVFCTWDDNEFARTEELTNIEFLLFCRHLMHVNSWNIRVTQHFLSALS